METVREGERIIDGDVTVHVLGGGRDLDHALALLDAAEHAAGAPLVDEAERRRLRDLAEGPGGQLPHWHPLLARGPDGACGYAGIVIEDPAARADLAVAREAADAPAATAALFTALARVARAHGAGRLETWIRHAAPRDRQLAVACGYEVGRRLHVLGRDLVDLPPVPEPPAGLSIRPFQPDGDAAGVVDVLARAYAETPDGGWDRDRFERRTDYDWFDPEDLLVADDGAGIVGIHWTKRRGDTVGEVYNLAVHPRMQGAGLGRVLLLAGLHHLRERGCERVILWVDADNDAGRALYAAEGFAQLWVDVAFACRP